MYAAVLLVLGMMCMGRGGFDFVADSGCCCDLLGEEGLTAVGRVCWDLRRGGGRLGFLRGEKTDPSDEFPLAPCEGDSEGDRG